MNNNVKFLILSDLHFEKYQETKHQDFVLEQINLKISNIRAGGFEPYVILAGDINNQADSYPWMSKIKSKVLFIAGNHEFWNGDYYETLNDLKSKTPDNVQFLHNDVAIVEQYIVIASTLWTDIGKALNPDILDKASSRMNDMVYISAKKWYDNPKNVENLIETYGEENLQKTISHKLWNGLIEQEENAYAWKFIQDVSDVLETLQFSQEAALLANNSTDGTEDIIEKTIIFTEFKNPTLKYQEFLTNLANLPPQYALPKEDYLRLSKNQDLSIERIFQKLRQIPDLTSKEILMLTHHLPFYEELLIGQHRLKGVKSTALFNKIHHQNFFVREGLDYPEQNLLTRASKGEIARKDDITHTVNYFNNGSHYLPPFLQNKVNVWVHGHEHVFNYSDFLKGIQLITNPAGSTFSVIEFNEEGNVNFNKMYSRYYKITPQLVPKTLQDLKDSLTRTPIPTPTHKELVARVNIWAMTVFDWTEYLNNIERMLGSCANIVNSAVEFSSIEISNLPTEDKQQQINKLVEKTNQYVDIFNLNLMENQNLLNDFALAVEARINKKFSIQRYFNSINKNSETYYRHITGSVPELFKLADFMGMFTGGLAFKNIEYLLLLKKLAADLSSFSSTIEALEPIDVSLSEISEFYNIVNINQNTEEIQISIDKKWMTFLNSLKFNQNSPFGDIESLD